MHYDDETGWQFAPTDNLKARTLEELRARDARVVRWTMLVIVVICSLLGVAAALWGGK